MQPVLRERKAGGNDQRAQPLLRRRPHNQSDSESSQGEKSYVCPHCDRRILPEDPNNSGCADNVFKQHMKEAHGVSGRRRLAFSSVTERRLRDTISTARRRRLATSPVMERLLREIARAR